MLTHSNIVLILTVRKVESRLAQLVLHQRQQDALSDQHVSSEQGGSVRARARQVVRQANTDERVHL